MKNLKLKNKQKGAALAIGMILLLIISVIGITSMKSATLQERMAGGLKNRELADAAALSLMVEVESYLFKHFISSNGVDLGLNSAYLVSPRSDEAYDFRLLRDLTTGYSGVNGVSINSKFGGILDAEPRFIIESISDANTGGSGNNFGDTGAEEGDGSSGGANSNQTGSVSKFFRIITKATGVTGHEFAAFESFMSVRVR